MSRRTASATKLAMERWLHATIQMYATFYFLCSPVFQFDVSPKLGLWSWWHPFGSARSSGFTLDVWAWKSNPRESGIAQTASGSRRSEKANDFSSLCMLGGRVWLLLNVVDGRAFQHGYCSQFFCDSACIFLLFCRHALKLQVLFFTWNRRGAPLLWFY